MIANLPFRAARLIGASLLVVLMIAAIGGCRSSAPVLSQDEYQGPPIEVTARGKFYLLRFQAPSAGWQVSLDEVRPSLESATLLVTAREPDPSYMHAQVIVTQDVLTTVETTTPISIHARVTPFVTSSKTRTYRFLGKFGPLAPGLSGPSSAPAP